MTSRRHPGDVDPSELEPLVETEEEDPTSVRRNSARRSAASGSHSRPGVPSHSQPGVMPRSTVNGYRSSSQSGRQPVMYPPQMPQQMMPPVMPQQQPEPAGFRMSLPGLILMVLALLTVGAVLAVVIVKVVVPQNQKTIVLPGSAAQPSTVVMPLPLPSQQAAPAAPVAGQPAAQPGKQRPARGGKKVAVGGQAGQEEDNTAEEQPEEQAAPTPPPPPAAEKKPPKQEGWPDPFSAE